MEAPLPERLNEDIAGRLEEVAQLLATQGASRFRVRAYQRAAETVRRLTRPVSDILAQEGLEGLQALPGVGESIARAIRDILARGRLAMLERLRGESDPAKLLASVPGIGRATADRLHQELGLETLEDLEAAAHDGRLEQVAGLGQAAGRHPRLARAPPVAPQAAGVLGAQRPAISAGDSRRRP